MLKLKKKGIVQKIRKKVKKSAKASQVSKQKPTKEKQKISLLINRLSPAARKSQLAYFRNRRISNWMVEAELIEKYPQVIPGTLRYDEEKKQRFVTIMCANPNCSETRETTTNNLTRVTLCVEHKRERNIHNRNKGRYNETY